MERCSFVFVATFLSLFLLTSCSEGQPHDMYFSIEPEPHYYVTKNQITNVTCEVVGAITINMVCVGSSLSIFDEDYEVYQRTHATHSSGSMVWANLQVSWERVHEALDAGKDEFWCQCVAKDNDYVSFSGSRTVISPAFLKDQFQEPPVSQTVEPGSQTVLTCTPPLGDPEPQVTWWKDGNEVELGKDDNLVVGADDSLTIVNARPDDAGTYQCVAKNLAGLRQSVLATLKVKDVEEGNSRVTPQPAARVLSDEAAQRVNKPVFTEQPVDEVFVLPSQPATIICSVEGATRMTVRCNNQRIEPNRLRTEEDRKIKFIRHFLTLTYPEVQNYINTYDEEEYKCECVAWYTDPSHPRKWDYVLSRTGKIYLAFLDKEFEAHPEDLTAQMGTSASLTCRAPKGLPAPEVTWLFKQQKVEPSFDGRYTVSEDGTLTITNLDNSDAGRYYCVAQNAMGVRQSDTAELIVSSEPVAEPMTPSPTPHAVVETETVYVATFPPVIPDVPVFTRDLQESYYLDENGEARLVCSVVAADMLTYRCMGTRLMENDQVIDMKADRESAKRLLTATTVVTKAKLATVPQGEYTCQCVAWNIKDGAWHHNFSTAATVRYPYIDSMFIYEPQGGLFYAGDSAEFACHPPGGQPTPKVMWLKDGQVLDPKADDNLDVLPNGGLIIDRVRPEDAGEYTCVAVNAAGRQSSNPAVLEVYLLPTTPTDATRTPKPTEAPPTSTTTEVPMDKMSTTTDFSLSTSKSGRIIPFFTNDVIEEAYVIDREPAMLTCGAVEATRLVFVCNGNRVSDSKIVDAFKVVDPPTGYTIQEMSVRIDRADVEQAWALGDYRCHCRAYYPGDDAESWDFVAAPNTTVKIAYLGREFVEEPVQQIVELGVSTELVCRPPAGVPEATVFWVKDGYQLQETNNIRVTPEGSLVFEQVTMADSGNYTCMAENIIGTMNSVTVPMVVSDPSRTPAKETATTATTTTTTATTTTTTEEPEPEGEGEGTPEPAGEVEGEGEAETEGESWDRVPEFLAVPESMYYIIKSRPVSISCQASGAENINFNCNGESIPQSRVQYEDMDVEGYGMVMMASVEISRQEVENYNNRLGNKYFYCQCYAQYSDPNLADPQYVVSGKGYVEVAYLKKLFKREPFNITVEEGAFQSLPCDAPEGNPVPEVYWTLNGERVESQVPTSDRAYIISSAGAADAGVYECVATNLANTRRSRPGSIFVNVGGKVVTGLKMTDSPPTDAEPESTTPDYDMSWNGEMTHEQKCIQDFQSCLAMLPIPTQSGPNSPACRNAPRFIDCMERVKRECSSVISAENWDAAEEGKKLLEEKCTSTQPSGGVCQELMDCQSEYSKQNVPNADAETTPMEILCEGIHSFLRCAESAARTCKIPHDAPDTSLTDLAEWFEEYCMKVVDQEWAKECPSFSQCDLPIEQTTILSNLVQAKLWCPYVEETMACTRQAVSDCGVGGVQKDLTALDTLAKTTCPASADPEEADEKEDEHGEAENEGGDNVEGELEDAIGESKAEDGGDAEGNAWNVRASVLLTSLLPVALVWMTWR